jgi:hypothetical protein
MVDSLSGRNGICCACSSQFLTLLDCLPGQLILLETVSRRHRKLKEGIRDVVK